MHIVKVPVLVPKLSEDIEILLDALIQYELQSGIKHKRYKVQNLISEIEGLLSSFDKVEAEMLEHSNRV